MHILIAIILICFSISASPQGLTFRYSYNVNDGLSDNRVYNMAQDERGFIWIGTHNGLNRFDGKNFSVFNSNNSDLLENLIWDIKKGPGDQLLLGTHMGAVLLDCKTGIMKNILAPSIPELYSIANDVRNIEFTTRKEIILGTQGGIYIFDLNNNLITKKEAGFDLKLLGVRRLNFVRNMSAFTNGDVLVSTTMGYYYYKSQTKEILPLQQLDENYSELKNFLVDRQESYVFKINNKDQLFFIDHTAGIDSLFITDLQEKKTSTYPLPFKVRGNIRWDSRIQFHADSLMTITTAREGFFMFSVTANRLEFLSGRNAANVFCQYVLEDSDRRMWLGTETGLLHGASNTGQINNISVLPFVARDNYHPITSVYKFDNRYWLTGYSMHSGLIVLDKNYQMIRRIDFEKKGADKNFIVNIVPWSDDTLLVGTKDGAYLLNARNYNNSPFYIPSSKIDLSRVTISQWFRDSKGNLWLSGGQSGGVWRVNKTKDSIQQYKPGKEIGDIPLRRAIGMAEDKDGNIWMLHLVDGMTRWNATKQRFDTVIRKWPSEELNRFDCTGIIIDSENNF